MEVCKEQIFPGALHYRYFFVMWHHFSMDREENGLCPCLLFLHSFCSLDVSLLFHLLFSFPVSFIETNVFSREVSCVCQELLLLRQQVLMDVGISAFWKSVLCTLSFVCMAFLAPLLGCLLSFPPCFLRVSSLAKRINTAIRASMTWPAELNTRCREAKVSKRAIS